MAAAVPICVLCTHETQVGLVDQAGGLERLAGRLAVHHPGGELAQLVVDQGQELFGRHRVALFDGREDAGNFVHEKAPTPRSFNPRPSPVTEWDSRPYPGCRLVHLQYIRLAVVAVREPPAPRLKTSA